MAFRFESLKIWHMARAYARTVCGVTARFPRKEDYGLTSQMNQAVHSIALNIAEGSAKSTARHFGQYLETALGSTFEVVAASFQALDQGYIDQAQFDQLYAEGEALGKSVNAFRHTLR